MTSALLPTHRPEFYERLRRGEEVVVAAMAGTDSLCHAKQQIGHAGEMHDRVYRVRTGWLCRTRPLDDGRRQIVLLFLPGEFCCLKCMLLTQSPEEVECVTKATVNWIGADELLMLADADRDVALWVIFQLSEEERRLHNRIVALGRGKAEERLAAFFLDLRARIRLLKLGDGTSFNMYFTQRQLADLVGLTEVHINRVLRQLRQSGIMTVKRSGAIIHDLPALQRIGAPMLDTFERNAAARHYGSA